MTENNILPIHISIDENQRNLELKINHVQDWTGTLEKIRACPAGRKYDPVRKIWTIPLCLENLQALIRIEEIKGQIFEIGEKLLPPVFPETCEQIGFGSFSIPLAHQKQLVSFLLQYPGNGYLIFGGLGTGKTAIMAYLILNRFRNNKKILVVCPNKVKPVWPKELELHAGLRGIENLNFSKSGWTKKRRTENIKWSHRYIINYESLRPDLDALLSVHWDLIIFDESHRIKNPTAACTKAAVKIVENNPDSHIYCLTGTPRSNSDLDVFSQARVVNPYLFGRDFYGHRLRWFHQENGFNMLLPIGKKLLQNVESHEIEKIKKIKSKYTINTGKWVLKPEKKEDYNTWLKRIAVHIPADIIDLPPITYCERYADIPPEVMKKYREIKELLFLDMKELGIKKLTTALQRDSKLLQICSGVVYGENREIIFQNRFKADLLFDIVENEIEEHESAIVWFNYLHTLQLVEKIAKKNGIKTISVYGGQKDTKELVEQFEKDDTKLLLATNTIAEGQTILKPRYTIKFDHNFMPLLDWQRTKRNHRQGQTKPVIVIDLVSPGTIEEKALEVLRANESRAKEILDSLTMEDLK